ncbi:MAG TPA: glycoside hydrolase family 31, partial [Rhodanobacter sp.]|nr:glycoside hydrolase family 31 [Rhodanobacter sp.]
MTTRYGSLALAALLLIGLPMTTLAAAPAAGPQRVAFHLGATQVTVQAVGDGVLHVQALPAGASDAPTLVLDPSFKPAPSTAVRVQRDDHGATLTGARFDARWNRQ